LKYFVKAAFLLLRFMTKVRKLLAEFFIAVIDKEYRKVIPERLIKSNGTISCTISIQRLSRMDMGQVIQTTIVFLGDPEVKESSYDYPFTIHFFKQKCITVST